MLPEYASSPLLVPALLVALLCLAVSCGDDAGPTQVTNGGPPPIIVESGTFEVTSWSIYDGCALSSTLEETYDIQIDSTSFTMGDDWFGEWDEKRLQANAESEHVKQIQRLCTITTWTTVHITFTSEDEFSGDAIFRHRISGTCENETNCQTTWRMTGIRQ
jgi:hypothetical protein